MADIRDARQMLYENLRDAECPKALMDECMTLAELGQDRTMLQKLSGQRAHLLDEIHRYQKALDCLDYLIFQLNRKESFGRI